MSSNYCFNITLHRDSLHTPWGFRLEGGREFTSPLTIQRVFQGSPATGYLQRGDIILNIQNRDATSLFHQEANELIHRAGGSLLLTIRRGQAYPGYDGAYYYTHHQYLPGTTHHTRYVKTKTEPISPIPNVYTTVTNTYYDVNALPHDDDPSHYVRNRTIEQVKDPRPILSQTGSPILPYSSSPSSIKRTTTMRRYRPAKTVPITSTIQNVSSPVKPVLPYQERDMIDKLQTSLNKITVRPRPVSVVNYYTTSLEPTYEEYGTVANKVASYHKSHEAEQHRPPANHYYQQQYTTPWEGTLRRTSSSRNISYPFKIGEAQKPKTIVYKTTTTTETPGQLRIVNNQYNTPIGLYSKTSADEELNKQIGHKFGGVAAIAEVELPSSDF